MAQRGELLSAGGRHELVGLRDHPVGLLDGAIDLIVGVKLWRVLAHRRVDEGDDGRGAEHELLREAQVRGTCQNREHERQQGKREEGQGRHQRKRGCAQLVAQLEASERQQQPAHA
ncbi:hypothetical protein T492DRAFT_16199 [Pavlovales sp. CCMP2436]|nr:hypothetical protein T492DRAFT_16199 [Pavlovales sp. CCMP2436]